VRCCPGVSNQHLAGLIAESEFSHKGFARRLSDAAPLGGAGARTSPTQVARWVGGQVPRDETVELCALVLGRQLGRHVSREDMGFPASHRACEREGTDGSAARLWRADASGNEQLRAIPFTPEALDRPVMDWLLGTRCRLHHGAGRGSGHGARGDAGGRDARSVPSGRPRARCWRVTRPRGGLDPPCWHARPAGGRPEDRDQSDGRDSRHV
jgi:hypothetical protein